MPLRQSKSNDSLYVAKMTGEALAVGLKTTLSLVFRAVSLAYKPLPVLKVSLSEGGKAIFSKFVLLGLNSIKKPESFPVLWPLSGVQLILWIACLNFVISDWLRHQKLVLASAIQ